MNARLRLVVVGALALGFGGSACSRAHLTASHGRAYHDIFAAQDANPNRKGYKSVHGLDSQEASIIAGTYRKALSPKEDSSGANQQLLTTSKVAGVGMTAVPATSVPSGGN
jgi:hypothetical protein